MRNIFDQYTQPENRLTHCLASVLHRDPKLLKSFLSEFVPQGKRRPAEVQVIEQSLPGRPEYEEGEKEAQGLPDALIYSEADSWALVIESKVNDVLAKAQLVRHSRTVERCGFEQISGLAITVHKPRLTIDGWHLITWRDIYSWASAQRRKSSWAQTLVEYFNVAEARMAAQEYLKEGTITEFSGVSFDPYSYLEGKRILRLLTAKLRENAQFVGAMRLDSASGRSAITDQDRLWDFLSFLPPDGTALEFQRYPHCTVGIGPDDADAMITFPNGMSTALRRKLHGNSFEEFAERLAQTSRAITTSLKNLEAIYPIARVQQRRYKSQRSIPVRDGFAAFDLRTVRGDEDPQFGRPVKQQQQWARTAYELLANKHSNLQFQIGVLFDHAQSDQLANKNADVYFAAAFQALRSFAAPVLDNH